MSYFGIEQFKDTSNPLKQFFMAVIYISILTMLILLYQKFKGNSIKENQLIFAVVEKKENRNRNNMVLFVRYTFNKEQFISEVKKGNPCINELKIGDSLLIKTIENSPDMVEIARCE